MINKLNKGHMLYLGLGVATLLFIALWAYGALALVLEISIALVLTFFIAFIIFSFSPHLTTLRIKQLILVALCVVSLSLFHGSKASQGFSEAIDGDSLLGVVWIIVAMAFSVRGSLLMKVGLGIFIFLPVLIFLEVDELIVKRLIIHALFLLFAGIMNSLKSEPDNV